MNRHTFFLTLLGISGLAFLSGCGTTANPETEPEVAKTGPGFLETDYPPLEHWFNERFAVKYSNMTPDLIFNQVPIDDINYETKNLPSGPELDLDTKATRRGVLKEIADYWDLDMSIKNGPDGNPSVVLVEGKG